MLAIGIVAAMLLLVGSARAGTYVINNCPSAPVPNGDSGAWVILAGEQGSKASCGAGAGDYIGPLGANMSPGTVDGVQISAPAGSGVTFSEAKVWWYVPQHSSGATIFAIAAATGGAVGEYATPTDYRGSPDVLVLPSSTTSLTLADYCSNDDAGQGCAFGDDRPNLLLFGSQLTLSDSRLPNGAVTGGGLTGAGPLSATQAIAYNVEDADSGVRVVELLVDGQDVAHNDYLAKCPYASFLACPASESGSLSWNTATVADGQHSVALVVQSAAKNSRTIFASTITAHNAPANLSAPGVGGQGQSAAGVGVEGSVGTWSTPPGAGSIAYSEQWQSCDSEGSRCTAIAGAFGLSYTPSAGDVGHTLRLLVSATNDDGATSTLSAATGIVASSQSAARGGIAAASSGATAGTQANGSSATQAARVRLDVRGRIARTYAAGALRLPGKLVSSGGQPISGANVDVLARNAGSERTRVLAHARTGADGSFVADVPGGSSRLIEVAYRAFGSDAAYSARASLRETVGAGVVMQVTPRRTGSAGTIRLSGHVQGPIPAHGVIVELLVHYLGEWQPFRTPRTDSHGRFAVSYRFQGGVGRFPFRAQVPAGQVGFPFSAGFSRAIAVSAG